MTPCAPPSTPCSGCRDHRRGFEVPCGHHRGLRAGRGARHAGEDTGRLRDTCRPQADHQRRLDDNAGYRPAPDRSIAAATSTVRESRSACISDSYNTARNFVATGLTLTIHEAQDIASCDLPGTGNPCGNTQPVVVLKDFGTFPNTSAHGRGPRHGSADSRHGAQGAPRLCDRLSTVKSSLPTTSARWPASRAVPNARPGFAAQIIVDDVQYFDEGMFADTVVAQAVDDVTALGVSYFSSAGNTAPTQGYASDLRIVPTSPARPPGRTSVWPASPPTCTPAASTTSAAMAA